MQYLGRARQSQGVTDYGQGFRDTDRTPGAPQGSHTGRYDGVFPCTIAPGTQFKRTDSGDLAVIAVRIEASSNPEVRVGEVREVEIWMRNQGADELRSSVDEAWKAKGQAGDWPDAFYQGMFGEQQLAAGAPVVVEVSTAPKKQKAGNYTKIRIKARDAAPVPTAPPLAPLGASPPGALPGTVPAGVSPEITALLGGGQAPSGVTPELAALLGGGR